MFTALINGSKAPQAGFSKAKTLIYQKAAI
jgi:hypothetical protein